MSLDTQLPDGHREQFHSPDLKLRDSKTMWGPLQMSLHRHRQGAELGYQAGEDAYQELLHRYGQGAIDLESLEQWINYYFTAPHYRPRVVTEKIAAEWRAMFLLGWTSQILKGLAYGGHSKQQEPTCLYQQRGIRA